MDIEAGHGSIEATLASTHKPKSIAFSNKPPMIMPCIDKTSITIDEDKDDPHHKDAIRETMFHYSKQAYFPFSKYGRLSAKGGRYETALRVHAPNPPGHINGAWSQEFALPQCNPKNALGSERK